MISNMTNCEQLILTYTIMNKHNEYSSLRINIIRDTDF